MPTNKIEEVLSVYAQAKINEKQAKEIIEELAPQIKEYLSKEKVDKLPTSVGTFSLVPRSTWKYSEAVEKLQEEEKARGIAKQVTSITLTFKASKEEE